MQKKESTDLIIRSSAVVEVLVLHSELTILRKEEKIARVPEVGRYQGNYTSLTHNISSRIVVEDHTY